MCRVLREPRESCCPCNEDESGKAPGAWRLVGAHCARALFPPPMSHSGRSFTKMLHPPSSPPQEGPLLGASYLAPQRRAARLGQDPPSGRPGGGWPLPLCPRPCPSCEILATHSPSWSLCPPRSHGAPDIPPAGVWRLTRSEGLKPLTLGLSHAQSCPDQLHRSPGSLL